MAEIGWASLGVTPTFKNFGRNLDRGASPILDRFGRNAGSTMGKRAGTSFGRVFTGTLGALGVFSAGSAALRFLGDSVEEGRESVKVGRQTAAVIKSTGGAAKVTERQAGRLANRLSKLAGIDDELIQGGENVLLTFKNIRNEQGENNKVFDKANKAALNLSVAMGKDLNSSALMVGKALNDPVAGMTALGRAGVQFSQDQKDSIKRLVETGDTLGAQKIILRELNDQFRGSAKAQRTEADKLSVSWGNFKEQIGKSLLPVLDDLARFLRKEGIPRAREFFHKLRDDGVPAAKKIAHFAKNAAGEVKDLVDAFNGMPGWVKKVLVAGAAGAFTAKKFGLTKILTGSGDGIFSKGATPARPLYVWVVNSVPGEGGVPGKVPKIGSTLGKLGTIGAVLGGSAILLDKLYNFHRPTKAPLASLGGGGINDFLHERGLFGGDVKEHNRQLSETKKRWIDARLASKDYAFQVHNGIPRSALTTVTNWTLENRKAREYLATILEIRGQHITGNFTDFGSTAGQPPNHGGGGGGKGGNDGLMAASRGRPTVIIHGDVKTPDAKQFLSDLQRRSISGAADGWG